MSVMEKLVTARFRFPDGDTGCIRVMNLKPSVSFKREIARLRGTRLRSPRKAVKDRAMARRAAGWL